MQIGVKGGQWYLQFLNMVVHHLYYKSILSGWEIRSTSLFTIPMSLQNF